MSIRQWKAAICQAKPCWFDKTVAIAKLIRLIKEVKQNGALLIAFSKVWVPGYPNFLWSGNYKENIPLIYVGFGFSERVNASLYLAQVLIGPDGNILLHCCKTKPTHVKRTLFGDSTGDLLIMVVNMPLGKIGMLNCWEHLQPLLKYHTYTQGEQVYIAAWPFNGEYNSRLEPYLVCREANELTASRAYALEGGVYCLVMNQPLSVEGAKLNSEGQAGASKGSFMLGGGGGSAVVFGPDGRQLTKPIDPHFNGLIYCAIDLD
ncbi:carbon-nitrogen hydrolase [Aspergillus stella-maris]|uniref:carbon-nitrogen hydrolase n=1 Tax=Aspergillus stella-maris TaxID=1810926 RepID=UPI003CCD28CD